MLIRWKKKGGEQSCEQGEERKRDEEDLFQTKAHYRHKILNAAHFGNESRHTILFR